MERWFSSIASPLLATISHAPILEGLGEAVEFLHQWAWIEENVGGILPPGTSQIIDELRQQADAAREVIRHLHMCEHVGCVPDSESLPSLECKLLGVRRLKMDLDVSQCRGILVPCMRNSKNIVIFSRQDNAANCSPAVMHRRLPTASAVITVCACPLRITLRDQYSRRAYGRASGRAVVFHR